MGNNTTNIGGSSMGYDISESDINGVPSEIIANGEYDGIVTNAHVSADLAELEMNRVEWESPGSSFYGSSDAVESVEMRQKRMELLRKIDELILDASGMYNYGGGPNSNASVSEENYNDYFKHMKEYHRIQDEYDDAAERTYRNANIPEKGGGTITQTNPPKRTQINITPPPNPSNMSTTTSRTQYR